MKICKKCEESELKLFNKKQLQMILFNILDLPTIKREPMTKARFVVEGYNGFACDFLVNKQKLRTLTIDAYIFLIVSIKDAMNMHISSNELLSMDVYKKIPRACKSNHFNHVNAEPKQFYKQLIEKSIFLKSFFKKGN